MNQLSKISSRISDLRSAVVEATLLDETVAFAMMKNNLASLQGQWPDIEAQSKALIEQIRTNKKQPLIDQFLTEYGLSSEEGVQLMRLAEALSRTTDPITADALIRDKIMGQNWLSHTGAGHSLAMSASGRLLHLTDRWLRWSENATGLAARAVTKVGKAKLRFGTRTAIRALSSQFVFAETLKHALKRADNYRKDGYLFSFDMLGEAARTQDDANAYYRSYANALDRVAEHAQSSDPRQNNGISVKLSALHPRYEFAQADDVVPIIAEMLRPLAIKARAANVQITIDAEEAERLDISMDVFSALIANPELQGWDGLGFVVQAYQRRALPLLDWLEAKSRELGAPLYIRLVKGAYWDSEIKRAQEMGLESYPVYTRKEMTDLSYLACAQKLLAHPDCFHPQFATHNATSIAAIRSMAGDDRTIEFQRLFGMGQQLHDYILKQPSIISRIYAPVGTQKDLLSYLVRRLLENGANSSFVNKLADPEIDTATLTQSPLQLMESHDFKENQAIPAPRAYLDHGRRAAKGYDLSDPYVRALFQRDLNAAAIDEYTACPVIAGELVEGESDVVTNPANRSEAVGKVTNGNRDIANKAMVAASDAFQGWAAKSLLHRAKCLEKAADLLEKRASIFHYLAIKEAGKTWSDAIDEVREAIDFCRYYAEQAKSKNFADREALGVIICISPWNFPLAIFLGQAAAALVAGNSVVAKPAEQTPLIAAEAVRLLHDAGIDKNAINLVPGNGANVGEALISHPMLAGVCFTGSTAVAKHIAERLAETGRALVPFIAETGGINAMVVDSSALLEQTVDAVVSSAFQSAGQRCSALRILYIQDDIADEFIALLKGAMDALKVGDPSRLSTDIGPVIDKAAHKNIAEHISRLSGIANLIASTPVDQKFEDEFIAPTAFMLRDSRDLDREIFGPVLHIVRFKADKKFEVINNINASGYGLTLGIQSRIESQNAILAAQAHVGNIYINRNQIGAVVGVQPFGGAGLSGTGPKAGGPLYLSRLSKRPSHPPHTSPPQNITSPQPTERVHSNNDLKTLLKAGLQAQTCLQKAMGSQDILQYAQRYQSLEFGDLWAAEIALAKQVLPASSRLPSPTGETNDYSMIGRGIIISLLKDADDAVRGCVRAIMTGNSFLQINEAESLSSLDQIAAEIAAVSQYSKLVEQADNVTPNDLEQFLKSGDLSAVLIDPNDQRLLEVAAIIAKRDGAILPILTTADLHDRYVHEKTITDNIAAAGGDVNLLNAGTSV